MKPQPQCIVLLLAFLTLSAFPSTAQNPGGVTGSSFWLRADANTSTTTDGNGVWYWQDQASGLFAYQFGTQPTYQDDATYDIDYNPVLRFAGGATMDLLSLTGLPSGKTARTIITVATAATTTGTQYVLSMGKKSNGGGYSIGAQNTQGLLSGNGPSLATPAGFWQAGQPNMMTATWAGNGGTMNLYGVGSLLTGASENMNTNLNSATIGAETWDGNDTWNGNIAEVIIYNSNLSAANLQKIGSYLALRYGFTLGGSAPQNYESSTSATIWNATTLATWSNNIAGLARDDNSSLDQLQSQSSNTGFQVTMGVKSIAATNSANTGKINTDRSFMIWGDDGQATSFTRNVTVGGTTYHAMPRTWTVSKTNWTDQNIQITQDSGSRATMLLVATDANFTNVTQQIPLSGGTVTVNSSQLPAGSFFTFGGIIPLPVTLVSFTGTATKTGNVLDWETAGETDNAYFAIERSTDGRGFSDIGTVTGNGTTAMEERYSYTDMNPVPGTVNYYRLRQVDNDGWANYSSVIAIRNDGGPLSYNVYPNPAQSTLHISIPNRVNKMGIFVYNSGGQPVLQEQLEEPGDGVDLDVSRLSPGMYYIQVTTDGERHVLSFIKQ